MNQLKELRKEKGLTQDELAKKIGISKRTLAYWEKGETQIKPDKAEKLADFFGVSVGYLLRYDIDFEKQIRIDTLNDIINKLHTAHISPFETINSVHFWAGFEAAEMIVKTQKMTLDFEEEE